MSKFSRHIKQEALRSIILQDSPCETRMAEIRNLVGLPQVSEETNGVQPVAVQPDAIQPVAAEPDAAQVDAAQGDQPNSVYNDSINRILDGLSGKELTTGRALISEIEKSQNIKWDENSLELIVNDKKVPYSNLNLLLSKVVQSTSPTMPLGLVTFINALLINRIPLAYMRDADTQNIRQALLQIKGITDTNGGAIDNATGANLEENVNEPEKISEQINTNGDNSVQLSRKRSREEEEEEEEEETSIKNKRQKKSEKGLSRKRSREEEEEEVEPSLKNKRQKKSVVPQEDLRRSNRVRLKGDLRKSWRELGN